MPHLVKSEQKSCGKPETDDTIITNPSNLDIVINKVSV